MRTEHFSDQAWADFVRGISPAERTQMESHVASRCAECSDIYNMWRNVQTAAFNESRYSVPEGTLRLSKLMFEGNTPKRASLTAALTFDSSRQLAFAGSRSAAAAARQMVYEVDGLAVDLRINPLPGSKRIQIIGQVLDKQLPRTSVHHAEVVVWTELGMPLAETKTNQFGEFSLELEPEDNLLLSLKAPGRPYLHIALANLSPSKLSPEKSQE